MTTRPRAVGIFADARLRVATGIEATINIAATNRYKPLFEAFIRYSWLVGSTCWDSIVGLATAAFLSQLTEHSSIIRMSQVLRCRPKNRHNWR